MLLEVIICDDFYVGSYPSILNHMDKINHINNHINKLFHFPYVLLSHVCDEAPDTGDTDTAAAGGTRDDEAGCADATGDDTTGDQVVEGGGWRREEKRREG